MYELAQVKRWVNEMQIIYALCNNTPDSVVIHCSSWKTAIIETILVVFSIEFFCCEPSEYQVSIPLFA